MGFREVFDDAPGKVDWQAYGLPVESDDEIPLVKDRLERLIPVCRLADSASVAKRAMQEIGANLCPIVNDAGIVLGLVGKDVWHAPDATPVEEIMEPAPTTIRPSVSIEEAAKMLDSYEIDSVLVTRSDGKLLGVFTPERGQHRKKTSQEAWPLEAYG